MPSGSDMLGQVFRIGDTVRIKSGAFAALVGKIEGINQAKSLLKVVLFILGRKNIAKVKFSEVEKVSFSEEA